MNNTELLTSISELLDQKLEHKLEQKFKQFKSEMNQSMEHKFGQFESGMNQNMEHKFGQFESGMNQNMERKFGQFESKMNQSMDCKLTPLIAAIGRIQVEIEHNIVPRLQNIEQCYISTYERYKTAADKLDIIENDVSLLKNTICEHSKLLSAFA